VSQLTSEQRPKSIGIRSNSIPQTTIIINAANMHLTFTCKSTIILVLVFVLLHFGNESVVLARKDRNQPHRHRGKLTPYTPGPFKSIRLSGKEEEILISGNPVMKQSVPTKTAEGQDSGGGAICVQDVAAPKAIVWSQILDLDNYSKKVNQVLISKNYFTGKGPARNSRRIKTRMVLGVLPGYSVRNQLCWHCHYPKNYLQPYNY
jgi:hypothetical protein